MDTEINKINKFVWGKDNVTLKQNGTTFDRTPLTLSREKQTSFLNCNPSTVLTDMPINLTTEERAAMQTQPQNAARLVHQMEIETAS